MKFHKGMTVSSRWLAVPGFLMVAVAACGPVSPGLLTCTSSVQCGEGKACIQYESDGGELWRICAVPCSQSQPCEQGTCTCPDSPLLKRCRRVDDGVQLGFCR